MPTLWRHIQERAAGLRARGPDAAETRTSRRAMAARWLRDAVAAATDIEDGPYAAFARDHRRRRLRELGAELERAGLDAVGGDALFAADGLPLRIQMARIVARCHDAAAEEKLTILACVECAAAGSAAAPPVLRVREAMGPLAYSGLAMLHDLVDLVFEALALAAAPGAWEVTGTGGDDDGAARGDATSCRSAPALRTGAS